MGVFMKIAWEGFESPLGGISSATTPASQLSLFTNEAV
jgi:hypothetical protein